MFLIATAFSTYCISDFPVNSNEPQIYRKNSCSKEELITEQMTFIQKSNLYSFGIIQCLWTTRIMVPVFFLYNTNMK